MAREPQATDLNSRKETTSPREPHNYCALIELITIRAVTL